MKITKGILALLPILISIQVLNAQDQIFKKTKEVIECKVKEIGLDEIKYQINDREDEIIFSIDKMKVSKLILANGEEVIFEDDYNNPENYIDNKKNALKIDFLSPLTGNTTFSYERSIRPGRSYELTLGIIGLGIDPDDYQQAGFFIKGGVKLIKSPDFYLRGMRYAHVLKGAYFKPELAFGYYNRNYRSYDYFYYNKTTRESCISGALFLNIGKQWIMDNSFLMDFYFGIGYGFDDGPVDGGYHYGYMVGSSKNPIAAQAGLKIGFLFK